MEVNKYQTAITQELLDSLNTEVRDSLLDALNNVEFINKLISPNRLYAKDLPKDSNGKIIVDLCNPHILEDMDYFRPTAIHFQKTGELTSLRPNSNPNSEFGKWIRQERDRAWYGMVRPSDGEWITGDMYFYLNYCPILQSKIRGGTKKADRIIDFPEVWEGIYLRFHYIEQARNGGLYNNFEGGNHGAELASRGKGKSYSMAAKLAKIFILGENELASKEIRGLVTAYQKEFLTKDGVLNKFISMIDFCAQYSQFPSKRLKASMQDMIWKMGYIDMESGTQRGTLNEVIGVSSKDDESKLRGKRAAFIGVEEFGCHIKGTEVLMYDGSIKKVENILIGDYLMGDDNTPRIVEKLYNGEDQLYKITLSNGDYQIVNSHHPIYFKKYNWHNKTYTNHTLTALELMQIHNLQKGYYIPKAKIKFSFKNIKIDPYFLGLWLGDKNSTMIITNELLYNKFKEYNLFNNKHIPEDFKINSSSIQLKIIAGLIDSIGIYNNKKNIFEIIQRYDKKHILDDIKFMCNSNGLKCSMTPKTNTRKKEKILYYRLRISGNLSIIPTKIKEKKGRKNLSDKTKVSWSNYTFKVEKYDKGEFYGFTIDKNHLFVLADLTVTHNTFPKLIDLYNNMLPSVQEGDIIFGLLFLQGTSGDKDSDFQGAQEIMYNPKGYNMYALPNVFDKNSQGKSEFVFFFGGYLNRKGCYNKDGVSDVVKAIIEILNNRHRVKYNSSDPNTILKTIAEVPITPSEAITKLKDNIFPVSDLNERLNQLDGNPSERNDIYIGELIIKDNNVEFRPTSNIPIIDFPHKDNKLEGAIEIFKMPERDASNKVFSGRYCLSLDPYDDDSSQTMSLGSIFVLDLWTDRIVAEYTGRPTHADDLYEIARRMTIFYNGIMNYENNKKGLFAYFSRMNCLYLLSDVLEFLKDKDMVKGALYGNKNKGTLATAPINNYARTLIRNWLIKPTKVIQTIDGEEVEVMIPNLYLIRNRALIKELIMWNTEGNFDRVSSLGMLMLLREDKIIMYGGDPNISVLTKNRKDYKGEDDFFKRNFDDRFKSKNAKFEIN